jgi:hypothetical protein
MSPSATSRHDRENASSDLACTLTQAITRNDTRLPWTVESQWTVSYDEAKIDLAGPDGLTARITVHVSGTQDLDDD